MKNNARASVSRSPIRNNSTDNSEFLLLFACTFVASRTGYVFSSRFRFGEFVAIARNPYIKSGDANERGHTSQKCNGGRTIQVCQQIDRDHPRIVPYTKTDAGFREVDL